jgi:hypothetical protein
MRKLCHHAHVNLSLLQKLCDFFNLAWDFLISKTNTSAAETTKISPAVCNIWMYVMGGGGMWDL